MSSPQFNILIDLFKKRILQINQFKHYKTPKLTPYIRNWSFICIVLSLQP